MEKAWHIRVYGMVQGVGFRPFVAELAEKLGITGKVKNAGGIVEIDASGETKAMEEFLRRLCISCPRGARVDSVEKEEILQDSMPNRGFLIEESTRAEEPMRLLPPDLATCESCEEELFTPGNRRFHHPFISCALCGPRYSILKQVPYDREHVTMDAFPMCEECAGEYQRPYDRRRHAQTICCPDCGPELFGIASAYLDGIFLGNAKKDSGEAALEEAIYQIRNGGIVAVKDIGGFHFVFLPEDQPAKRLREWKHREAKPFAVCFPSLEAVTEYCTVTLEEEKLLCAPSRPIVLLDWHRPLPDGILKGSSRIGAMLPCNPLQMLLTKELGPLVMTSGNRGNEPIITNTAQMNSLMKEEGCPDYILTHNRRILSPLDDSIFQVVSFPDGGRITQVIRRARGIVPEPVILKEELTKEKFAAGSDLKAVFAYGKGKAAYLSPHFGDLMDFSCVQAREHEMDRMKELFCFRPKETMGDLHPGFLSAEGVQRRIQHHYAHILSVMAEHGVSGPILGLAFDGTGYGTDGRIWGSEFLLCTREFFEKAASLRPVVFPGGDAAARHPALALTAYLRAAGIAYGDPVTEAALEKGIHTVENCSMGRLFDAASALLTGCRENTYEGQSAVELELLAEQGKDAYPLTLPVVPSEGVLLGDGPALIKAIYEAKEEGIDPAALALGFHLAVAGFAVEAADHIAKEKGIRQIALSGGSFVNRILLREIVLPLRERGYEVLCNETVPCGDGGLALGQLWAL